MAEGYVRVAVDSTGKYIRNQELLIKQADGTYLLVEQQVVTRAADDGTILDTLEWVETARELYMRRLAEDSLTALQTLASLLGAPSFSGPPDPLTIIPGE